MVMVTMRMMIIIIVFLYISWWWWWCFFLDPLIYFAQEKSYFHESREIISCDPYWYRGHTRQASLWSVNGASPKKARVKSGWYEVHRSHIYEPLVTFWVHPSISINTPKQPWDGCPIMSFRVKCQDESLLRIRGLSGRYRVRTLPSLGCSSAISGTHLAAFAIQSMEKNTSPGPWDSNSSVDTTWCWRKRERDKPKQQIVLK